MPALPTTTTLLALLAAPLTSALSATPLSRLHIRDDNATGPAAPSCADTSTDSSFAWTAHSVYFHSSVVFSTPAHQIDGGFVSFNLSNPAVVAPDSDGGHPAQTSCAQSSTQLHDFFYGNQWFPCADVWEPQVDESGSLGTQTWFRFDRLSGRVDVNQTWTCTSGNGTDAYPVFFNANGTAAQELSCNTTTWQNTNWTLGSIYSTENVECEPIDLVIPPSFISESA